MTARFIIKIISGEFNVPVTVKIEADNSEITISEERGRITGTEFVASYDREYVVSIKSKTVSNIYVDVPVKVTLQKGAYISIQAGKTGNYRAMAYVPGTITYHTVDRDGSFPGDETFNHSISSIHNNVYILPVTVRVCKSSTRIQTGQL
jgi:hypothetical protein